jgi:signal transduction histidine kinase
LYGTGERPEELAHDARNMVAALELYCDLLEEQGVLAAGFAHYAGELRLVAAASRRLVEKLAAFDAQPLTATLGERGFWTAGASRQGRLSGGLPPVEEAPPEPIANLAGELEAKRNLLAALAGPGVEFHLHLNGGALPVALTREDLTRILVNLVKNAVEAMPDRGRVELSLDEFHAAGGSAPWLVMKVEDSGRGIPADALESIFIAGYTTRAGQEDEGRRTPRPGLRRRGLGLSITRAIIEAAGGRIFAANRAKGGARFEIELPSRTCGTDAGTGASDFSARTDLPQHLPCKGVRSNLR